MNRKAQSGNVLFLILIAVALFAALSYAVTSSNRTGATGINDEKAELAAATILQWLAYVDAAVLRLNARGIAFEDISFVYNAKYFGGAPLNNYANNTRCTSDSCRIFMPDGGGVPTPDFTQYGALNPAGFGGTNLMPGYVSPVVANWNGAGTSKNDIVLWVYALDNKICSKINEKIDQIGSILFSGSYLIASDPNNWDSSAYNVTSSSVIAMDTFTFEYPTYCTVWHLLMKR